MDAEKIIEFLSLEPHPGEGGYYRETYRSGESAAASGLPPRYGRDKQFSTAIYYLLTPDTISALHRIHTDEVFHFYLGDPVTMLQIHPDGHSETITLGPDIFAGQHVQCVVPANVWQGMYLNEGGEFALMGTTVAPAFDFEDFEIADRERLTKEYPDHAGLIKRLTIAHPTPENVKRD